MTELAWAAALVAATLAGAVGGLLAGIFIGALGVILVLTAGPERR